MRPLQFNSVEDALLVFEHSEEPEARIAARIYLEHFLPPPVLEKLKRCERETLGIDKLTPRRLQRQRRGALLLHDHRTGDRPEPRRP
jgi:hypothetical protein